MLVVRTPVPDISTSGANDTKPRAKGHLSWWIILQMFATRLSLPALGGGGGGSFCSGQSHTVCMNRSQKDSNSLQGMGFVVIGLLLNLTSGTSIEKQRRGWMRTHYCHSKLLQAQFQQDGVQR